MYQNMGYNQFYQPRQEILKVNGENGANVLNLAPNSSVLALDINQPVVWLIQTDGAGYKSTTSYSITPLKQTTRDDLEQRVKRLEEKLYEQSNITTAKQSTKNVRQNDESKSTIS